MPMIYITGDLHGSLSKLKPEVFYEQSNLTKDDYLIICGDFGHVWFSSKEPSLKKLDNEKLNWMEQLPYTILFVDGNHENMDELNIYPVIKWHGGYVHQIRPGILHLMRGEVFTIEDKKFFTFGGASSHDISDGIIPYDDLGEWRFTQRKMEIMGKENFRVEHVSWWKEELPNAKELKHGASNLIKNNWQVDFVISHCLPSSIQSKISKDYQPDLLTDYFDELLKRGLKFTNWICGHYHIDKKIDDYVVLYDQIVRIG